MVEKDSDQHTARRQDTHDRDGPADDVAKEPYHGPGALITGAGYLGVVHWIATGTAILAGLVGGALAYKNTLKIEKAFRNFGRNGGFFKEYGFIARTIRKIPVMAQSITKHVVRIKSVRETIEHFSTQIEKDPDFLEKINTKEARNAARWMAGVFAGGMLGAATWIGSAFWSFAHGKSESNKGRHQFERAKDEIWTLRAENKDLRAKYQLSRNGPGDDDTPTTIVTDAARQPAMQTAPAPTNLRT